MTSHLSMRSPVGRLDLCAADGAITGVHFRDFQASEHPLDCDNDMAVLQEARRQLTGYFASDLHVFDLPLAPAGTAFQHGVWARLRTIAYGYTTSYGEIATSLGLPVGSARAVGLANGANPIAIVVPCHRVIGADGSLTGYAGGLERKRYLLGLESSMAPQQGLFD